MRQARKDELISCFPSTPPEIISVMEDGGIYGRRYAANFCVFLTYGKELFVRCYHKYYRSKAISEVQRYVFAKDGFVRYGVDDKGRWKAMRFREPVFYNILFYTDQSYTLLNVDAIDRSDMRYSRLSEWTTSSLGAISYLRLYCKHPNIEYLIESGYKRLISEAYDYYGKFRSVEVFAGVDLRSNDLLKMLQLTRTEFKLLQGHENLYTRYCVLKDQLPDLKPEERFEIADSVYYANDLITFSQEAGTTVMRMFHYLNEKGLSAVIYRDYINQCRKLGYDMHDTAIGLPHDFLTAHERFSQIVKYQECEKNQQEFAKRIEARKVFEYESSDLILRQPQCYEEIIAEGKALCHCVGGYTARHSQGKTNIFFIRKKSEPLKPYYTIEVSNNFKIVQCYSYKNNREQEKPDEIKAFEREYQNYLEELKNERKRIKLKSA